MLNTFKRFSISDIFTPFYDILNALRSFSLRKQYKLKILRPKKNNNNIPNDKLNFFIYRDKVLK